MKKIFYIVILLNVGLLIQVVPVRASDNSGKQWNRAAFNVYRALGLPYVNQVHVPPYGSKHYKHGNAPHFNNDRYRHQPWQNNYLKKHKGRFPLAYKKVWNPGHYDHKGRWVPGRWIKIKIHPGHR